MPYRRRNQKRHRNKSSPQILSTPKKHRQAGVDCDNISELAERTDSETESADNSTMNSTLDMGLIGQCETVQPHTNLSEQEVDMSQSLLANTGSAGNAPHVEEQEQYTNVVPQFAGAPGAGVVDANMMQSATSLNFPPPPPPHMLNYAQPLSQPPNFQQCPQVLQYSRLTDDDVIRVASQLKTLLWNDINELIAQRVALAVEPLKLELANANTALGQVQKELKQVILRNDELEQYSRRSCLRISGIPESANEDVSKVVLDIARRVGADIKPEDIDRTHRVGVVRDRNVNRNDENEMADGRRFIRDKGREIIIKFNNYNARLKMLKGRASLREQKANIYINEDLTKTRKDLAFECRRLLKAKFITKTWVYNGNVYCQDRSNNKVRVTSLEDLDRFKSNNGV